MSIQNEESILTRLGPRNIDRRILFWIILILIVIIFLNPIGIPIKTSDRTEAAFEEINDLTADSIVLISLDTTGGAWGETGPLARAAFRHLTSKNVKIVFMGLHLADASALQEQVFQRVGIPSNWEYGENYLAFGFIPGREVAISQMAEDFPELLKKDFYGNNLADLELGQKIQSADDFTMVISVDSVGMTDLWVRHWATPFGTKVLSFGTASAAVTSAAYYPDLVQGIVNGIRGAAEYELLINHPEDGVRSTDMLSGTHLLIIATIIFGNIYYFAFERREE
jgi:hypothetical protein